MAGKNVPFRIAFVSSQEDENPAEELLQPGPCSRGWASSAYSIYPQELILQLDARTVIEKIQLMSHSFMVSSSMEIYLGDDPNTSEDPQYKRAEYIYLGEVKFDDPSSSQLKGRQLQTIEVQGNDRLKVSFVRLILKHFHFDKRNELNQVGLMGVSVLGICDQMKNRSRSQSRRGSRIDEFSAVPRRQDLAFLMYTDKDIAELIHQLEERKLEAVNTEQFENARKLKFAIDELLIGGQIVGALDAEKRGFSDRQEYDKAKDKKTAMEEKRDQLYKDLKISTLLDLPVTKLLNPSNKNDLPPALKMKNYRRGSVHSLSRSSDSEAPPTPPVKPLPPPIERKGSRNPVPKRQRRNDIEEDVKLSHQDRKELALAIEAYGLKVIAGALDKSPDVKKTSCESIKKLLSDYESDEMKPGKMLKATTQITVRLIRDKMWAIFNHGITLTNSLFNHFIFSHTVPKKELGESSLKLYKELLTRCSESNERVQDKAEDTLEAMVINEKIRNAELLHEALLKPLQQSNGKEHPRMALVRVDLAFYLIDEAPDVIGTMPATKANKLAEFGLSAVKEASAPVRKAGERFMIRLFELHPKVVRKAMPPDNPQTRKANLNYKHLYDEFIKMENEQ